MPSNYLGIDMRTADEIRASEQERIAGVMQANGVMAGINFARQGLKQYRGALAQRTRQGKRTGYGLSYRFELVVSCLTYRAFLRSFKAI